MDWSFPFPPTRKKKIKILLILSPTLITGMLIMCQKNYIICILIWCKAKQLFAAVGQCTFTVVARYPNWDFTSWPVKDSFQFNATPHCSYICIYIHTRYYGHISFYFLTFHKYIFSLPNILLLSNFKFN